MNVFDLYARIKLDTKDYEKNLGDAKSKFSGFADGIKSAAGKVGDVLSTVGKTAAVGIGAASTALAKITKDSLDIYANFEQLEGGAKLMFGDAADFIIQKSQDAYKNVQLSQNEYLEQVNGFAVGLQTALGGNEQAAAELADKIVTAEADIVAATGNTQEMVQNAFNGIMRTNYTMLDNLGLGIKPTKDGMQEVIDKVNEWNEAQGIASQYSIENLADVQSALVDYIEMQGMAGYASMEAGSTITGSIAGVKAAWQNFLSGNGSVEDFTQMLVPTVENLRERLQTLLPRITDGLTELVDLLAPEIPPIIENTLPTIIRASSTLITGLAKRLPELLTAILPSLASGVVDVTTSLVRIMPQLITSLKQSIPIVVKTIMEKKDDLKKAGKDIISALFPKGLQGVTEIASKATEVVGELAIKLTDPENLGTIFDIGFDIINSISDGLLSDESIDKFIETAPKIIHNLATGISNFMFGKDKNETGGLFGAVLNIVERFSEYFSDEENRENFAKAAEDILIELGDFLVENVYLLAKYALKIGQALAEMVITAFMDNLIPLFDSEAGWMDEYLNADTNLTYPEWAAQRHEEERVEESQSGNFSYGTNYATSEAYAAYSGNAAAAAAYEHYKVHGYATGGVFNRPTYALIGEDGAEAVMPLEKNTEWIDKLALRLGQSGANRNVVIEQIVVNAPTGNAEDIVDALVDTLDEKLRNKQIAQTRGIGGVAWQT